MIYFSFYPTPEKPRPFFSCTAVAQSPQLISYLTSRTIAATTDLASEILVPMMPLGPRLAHPLQYTPALPDTLPLQARTRTEDSISSFSARPPRRQRHRHRHREQGENAVFLLVATGGVANGTRGHEQKRRSLHAPFVHDDRILVIIRHALHR